MKKHNTNSCILACRGLTPEQKWRAEAIEWLENIGVKELQVKTNKELHKIIQEESNYLSYLMIEYIVNVKHDTTNQTNG